MNILNTNPPFYNLKNREATASQLPHSYCHYHRVSIIHPPAQRCAMDFNSSARFQFRC
jgi:hypothetical protein